MFSVALNKQLYITFLYQNFVQYSKSPTHSLNVNPNRAILNYEHDVTKYGRKNFDDKIKGKFGSHKRRKL